jgi:DNA-binding NarL/FixJ family response regulator
VTKPVSREKLMEAIASAVFPGAAKKIRVLLVDDHETFRRGIARILKSEPDVEVAGEAGNGESAVNLTRSVKPDVVLMDIYMPRMDGIQATRIIHHDLPEVRVIALSMKERSESAGAMEEAGAVSYLTKAESTPETMLSAIRACA